METFCICKDGTGERMLGSVGLETGTTTNKIVACIQGNNLHLYTEQDNIVGDIPIKFCPLCGEKLKARSYFPFYIKETKDKAAVRVM